MATQFTKWANETGAAALNGTWAKIGKSRYKRATGEIVTKIGNVWKIEGGKAYQSRAAAFSAVDYATA
jgi:hypothetical protein